MITAFLRLSILVCLAGALAADPIRITASLFGGSGKEELVSVAFAPDGTLVVLGTTTSGTWTLPNGVVPTVIGSEGDAAASTIFIARFTNDGRRLLSFTRFGWGALRSSGRPRQLAVNANGIYVIGWATSQLQGLRTTDSFGTEAMQANRLYPMAIRLDASGSAVTSAVVLKPTTDNGTYTIGGSIYDANAIDLFPNGDVLVAYGRLDSNFDYLARISPDFATAVWSRWANRVRDAGTNGSRLQTAAVSADGSRVYMGGYGMGHTGLEPYKNAFIFTFDGATGDWLWDRTPGNAADFDYGVYNFPQASIGANRLISDTTVNALRRDDADGGRILVGAYSDGGASVLRYQPMDGGIGASAGPELPSAVQDGDDWAGLGGATSVSIVGRLNADGTWHRSHRLRGRPSVYASVRDLCSMDQGKVISVGRAPDLPDINEWDLGARRPASFIMKTALGAAGPSRAFLTHLDGVDTLASVARDRSNRRYAAVGHAFDPAASNNSGQPRMLSAPQAAYGGGASDGYLVVFDDSETPSSEWTTINAEADTWISPGDFGQTPVNYGTLGRTVIHVRDYSDYWQAEVGKTYYRFDLSAMPSAIQEAGLQCWRDERYSDGQLRVYGLSEGQDGWGETTITWANAPANPLTGNRTTDYHTMIAAQSVDLGAWPISNTTAEHTEAFTGETLRAFLEQARAAGDRKATIVIVQSNTTTGGVSFTSREGAPAKGVHPPRLRLRLAGGTTPPGNQAPTITAPAAASSPVVVP